MTLLPLAIIGIGNYRDRELPLPANEDTWTAENSKVSSINLGHPRSDDISYWIAHASYFTLIRNIYLARVLHTAPELVRSYYAIGCCLGCLKKKKEDTPTTPRIDKKERGSLINIRTSHPEPRVSTSPKFEGPPIHCRRFTTFSLKKVNDLVKVLRVCGACRVFDNYFTGLMRAKGLK